MPCECVAKCWLLSHRIIQSFDSFANQNKNHSVFWTCINKILNYFKKMNQTNTDLTCNLRSNKVYIQCDPRNFTENFNYFILLLNNDIYNCIRSFDVSCKILIILLLILL